MLGLPEASRDEPSVSPSTNASYSSTSRVEADLARSLFSVTGTGPPPYARQNIFAADSATASTISHPRDDRDDVVIAVMGATGTGKTTFINTASGSDMETSDGLFSCTSAIGVASPFLLDGRTINLIDTPGFDDTTRTDTDILKMIALFLTHSYEEGRKLAGVIYVHRISDFRMGGTSTRNFSMFRKLCGDSTLKNVVIMTNMWSEVGEEVGRRREQQLASEDLFFKGVLDKGARMIRHDGSQASAQAVLRYFLCNRPAALQIQRELVEEKKDILQTAAGEELNRGLLEQRRRHELEMAELEQEHQDALDAKEEETRLEVEAATEELRRKLSRIEEESRNLAANFQEENKRLRRRVEEMGAHANERIRRVQEKHQAEIKNKQQQRKEDAEHCATKREAELREETEGAKKGRSGFWDDLGAVLTMVVTGGSIPCPWMTVD